MTLRDRLHAMAQALPSRSASIQLTRDDLEALLGAPVETEPLADLTVEDVAADVDRAHSTVRGWCADGKLRAYRLNGREWRIPREALRDFLRGQEEAQNADPLADDDDLSSWRRAS